MSARRHFSAVTLFAFVATGHVAWAQETSPDAAGLEKVEQALQQSRDKQTELQARAIDAVAAQDKLSNQLVELAETVSVQERALAKIEKRQATLKTDIAERSLKLAEQQDITSDVLAGLQRLEQNPPPALVVAPDDVLTALRSAMMFGAVLPELKRKALDLHQQLTDLKASRDALALESQHQQDALQEVLQSRLQIKLLIDEKKAVALATTDELAAEKQRAEDLASQATTLKQLLAALEDDHKKAEAQVSAEAKAQAEAQRHLEAQSQLPTVAFSKSIGLVNYPAQGTLNKAFGVDTGFGSTLDGIVIATEKQAQVISPVAGKIEFAGKFRSFGQMVIINPGEGYLVLLAGLDHVDAAHGQSVKAGEPLGNMGDKASRMALTGGLTKDLTNATTPMLYVEFRRNGDPVDPAPWWIGYRQEAMR